MQEVLGNYVDDPAGLKVAVSIICMGSIAVIDQGDAGFFLIAGEDEPGE